jgi:hypothetical protein
MSATLASSGRLARGGAGALLVVKVARSLYERWEQLEAAERSRLAGLAGDVKDRALAMRGRLDYSDAEDELVRSSEQLAAAIADSAASDPEVPDAEVARLRAELRRELERVAAQSSRRAA